MTSLDGWKIHRDRGRCDKPGCPLASSDEFFAVLSLPECVRHDVCATCFHQLRTAASEPPIYWKARRREGAKRGPTIDVESLKMLFERLDGVEGERAAGLRYFVALLLLRKRALKMVDPVGPEQEEADLVVGYPRQPQRPPVALFAPELGPERLENLREELLGALSEDGDTEVVAEED